MIVGVLTRITGVIFSMILIDAIFHIRWSNGFFIAKGGWDFDLVLLAIILLIIILAQEISVLSRLKKIPSSLQ